MDRPEPEPIFYGINDVAKMIGLGRSKVWEMVATGELFSVRIGKRRLIPTEEIARWKEQVIAEAGAA